MNVLCPHPPQAPINHKVCGDFSEALLLSLSVPWKCEKRLISLKMAIEKAVISYLHCATLQEVNAISEKAETEQ